MAQVTSFSGLAFGQQNTGLTKKPTEFSMATLLGWVRPPLVGSESGS
jgi:hypothetical protein